MFRVTKERDWLPRRRKRVCRVTKGNVWLPRSGKTGVQGNERARLVTEKEENECVV
ncbi:hypothetical protein AB0Y20_19015 [Heyndrickxia oleronia]|uniref:hypothetical protein n=1 Tax=Heyndrickxia oleronia TaxID=38875 RepID=UPI003F232D34